MAKTFHEQIGEGEPIGRSAKRDRPRMERAKKEIEMKTNTRRKRLKDAKKKWRGQVQKQNPFGKLEIDI